MRSEVPKKQTLSSVNRESGVALIFVLVVLLITTIIGVSGLNSTMLDTQVAGNDSETRTVFQAAENLLASARSSDISVFSSSIVQGVGSITTLQIATNTLNSYTNTNLQATLRYQGAGTVAFGSSITKFKPQRFEANAQVQRVGSGARANHEQGIVVLSPGT